MLKTNKLILATIAMLLLATTAFAALKKNESAPMFSLKDLAGKDFHLSDVIGAKNKGKSNGVILSFFASWCVPCRHELPLFNASTEELNKKGITVVLIDVKEESGPVDGLLKELRVNKPVVLIDQDGTASDKYQLRFLPTTFFIDADGMIKDVVFGEIKDEKELMESARKLLK
jgi:cytochrome c biogenesis protein CcmG/thiol:disulfide interchange protein DsbE